MPDLLAHQPTYLTHLLALGWPPLLATLVLLLLTYLLARRPPAASIPPSAVLVPSTSTYPSSAYSAAYKLPIARLLSDLLHGRTELRNAHSGQALLRLPDIANFTPTPTLLFQYLATRHSARSSIDNYVLASDAVLEAIQGPDRLPLAGCFRDSAPSQLESALDAQLARIGRDYLDLQPDDQLLDIGMHWGDVSVYLAHEHRVKTTAVLPAASQLAHAANLAGESNARHLIELVHGDHRALPDRQFTKAMALDALDFVGARNLPAFFAAMSQHLELNARLFLQVTTTPACMGPADRPRGQLILQADEDEDEEVATLRLGEPEEYAEIWWYHAFRLRHIAPGADTQANVSIEHVLTELQRAGFEVMQLESLTTDYALTMATWCRRLCANKRQIEAEVGPDAYRAWELYLNWTQSLLARGRLHKHFVLAVKRM